MLPRLFGDMQSPVFSNVAAADSPHYTDSI